MSRTLSASVIEDLDSWQSDWIPALGPALPFLKSAARGQALFGIPTAVAVASVAHAGNITATAKRRARYCCPPLDDNLAQLTLIFYLQVLNPTVYKALDSKGGMLEIPARTRVLRVAMGKKLETVANIVLMVVVIVIGYTFIKDRYFQTSPAPNQTLVGMRLVGLQEIDWTRHRKTLLLAIRKDCRFCEQSLPFYRRLGRAWSSCGRGRVGLIGMSSDEHATLTELASQEGLNFPFVSNVILRDMGVTATPTLLLVDSSGTVVKGWVGILSPRQEAEVLKVFYDGESPDGGCLDP